MNLDLRGIIDNPGGKISFEYEPDIKDIVFDSIVDFPIKPKVKGNITNKAGVLSLSAYIEALCRCVCARCIKEFELPVNLHINAIISEYDEENQNTDNYFYIDDKVNLDDIIITEFLLDFDERILCDKNCAGLCQTCGVDLNKETCDCKKEVDPRFAKLAQLLE